MSERTIETLEAQFARRYSAPGAVATGLGRAAIYLAMETIEVRGKQVLVPDFICEQVVRAVSMAGGIPVFYPVPLDLAIRAKDFAAAIAPGTRAAVFVHFFGMPQPHLAELVHICRQRGIAVVEDCALALLTATEGGGWCGTLGDFATFSFTKNNWCFGGGMVLAREATALEKMRRIAQTLLTRDDEFCLNYGRLSELDFAANRPNHAVAAAERGYALQQEIAIKDERFVHANFFDAAPANLAMSPAAAARASRILESEADSCAQRLSVVERLRDCATTWDGSKSNLLFLGNARNGSYLVFLDAEGRVSQRIQQASEKGVTLRPAWCDYQASVPQTVHSQRLLVLEIHPETTEEEIQIIGQFLGSSA